MTGSSGGRADRLDRPGREVREANLMLTQLMKQVEASVPQVRGRRVCVCVCGVGGSSFTQRVKLWGVTCCHCVVL